MSTNTLVIGLDAADRRLFESRRGSGRSRGLDELADRYGVRTIAFDGIRTDDCLWASFQYALPPGEHGRYYWKREPVGDGHIEYCDAGEDDLVAFWEPLAAADLDVAVFDLPKNRLTNPANGLHLANWLVHGRYRNEAVSWPRELAREVLDRFGAPPPSPCGEALYDLPPGRIGELEGTLLESVRMKWHAARHYLDQRQWHVFMTSFKELHCASHLLWPRADGSVDERPLAERMPGTLLALQDAVESAVIDLVERSGAERLAIFSTTGMATNRTIDHLAPLLLRRLNSLYAGAANGSSPVVTRVAWNENCLALRIDPGQRALVPAIADALDAVRDGDTDRKLFGAIVFPRTRWPGSRSWKLPDIIAVLDRPADSPTRIHSPALGAIEGRPPPNRRGNHHGDGYGIFSPALATFLPRDRIGLHDIGKAVQSAFGIR